jgi:hypothetical protein
LVGRGWETRRRREGRREKERGKGKGKFFGIRESDLFMLIRQVEQSFVKGHDILSTLVTNQLQQVEKGF